MEEQFPSIAVLLGATATVCALAVRLKRQKALLLRLGMLFSESDDAQDLRPRLFAFLVMVPRLLADLVKVQATAGVATRQDCRTALMFGQGWDFAHRSRDSDERKVSL